ncbi:MAG: hypothetical protein JWO94_2403 [Verrucomicrobiaceae bacterium]|nr:hypothetical protein [Verrucomicrobiaceae bacterium]
MIFTLRPRFFLFGLLLLLCAPAAQALTAVWNQATDIAVTAAAYEATGDITFTLNCAPPTGTDLTVVQNTGLDFIHGTFSNLAQGQTVTLSYGGKDYPFVANYYGGTGNDLVLVWGTSRLMAWGSNSDHELGAEVLGNNSSTTPVAVSPLAALTDKFVVGAAPGITHSLALSADGKVFAWGDNGAGQLGRAGYTSYTPVPVDMTGVLAGKTVVAISAGLQSGMALTSEGKVYTWGSGNLGRTSTASFTNVPVAVDTSGVLAGKTVVKIAAGQGLSTALCSDGTLVAWGGGPLGNNSATGSAVPVAVDQTGVLAGKTIIDVKPGRVHTLILCSDGKVYAYGSLGMLGTGSSQNGDALTPVAVGTTGVLAGKTVTAIAVGAYHSLVLCSDGTLASWGAGSDGELGNNTKAVSYVPVAVVQTGVLAGKTPAQIMCSGYVSLVRCTDGTMAYWGAGPLGGLGQAAVVVPTKVDMPALAAGEKITSALTSATSVHLLAISAKAPTPAVPAPAIAVEDTLGNPLIDGAGTADFGYIGPSAAGSRTFVLKNTGTLPLTGIAISIDGISKANFSVSSALAATVQPGASTSFVVKAWYTGLGIRLASLHIASNDAVNGVFDIALKAFGVTEISFEKAGVTADSRASSVDINVLRTAGGAGYVKFDVIATPGTATTADFDTYPSQTLYFNDGATLVTLSIGITPNLHPRADEAFTLTLVPDNAALGAIPTVTVRIVDAKDKTKPVVTITSPANGAHFAEGTEVKLSGVLTDTHSLAHLWVAFNGSDFVDWTPAPTGLTRFAFEEDMSNYPPLPGLNTVTVKGEDLYGNQSAVITRTFYHDVVRPLVVDIAQPGGGKVLLPPSSTLCKVGSTYTITAVPDKGFIFDGWLVYSPGGTGVTPAMLVLPKLTFTNTESLYITAQFIHPPFTAGIIGTYSGLVQLGQPEADATQANAQSPIGAMPGNDNTGWLTAKVMSNGTVTGTLKIDGLALPFTGVFDSQGVAHFGPDRATTALLVRNVKPVPKSPLELSLNLDMTGVDGVITGSVVQRLRSTVVAESIIRADRAAYSLANKVPAIPDITSKPYTLVFKHRPTQPGLEAADYPQGDGYATGTVKTDGTVTFTGKLADGTAIATTATLSKDRHWALYLPLYTALQGCLAANMTVDPAPQNSDMQGSEVRWFRPYQIGVQWYPWGWAEGIAVDVAGSRYHVSIPGLNPVNAVDGNAGLNFTANEFSSVFDKDINISPAYVASKVPLMDTNFTLALNAATGLISGTFPLDDHTRPAWQGVIFEKGADSERGYGFFMTAKPRKIDGLGQGGGVRLVVKSLAQ